MKSFLDNNSLLFECPGCGCLHSIPVLERKDGKLWSWNNNLESPTCEPSILVTWLNVDGKTEIARCHSYLRDGNIQFLGDCTHSLAGQTVPLPNIED